MTGVFATATAVSGFFLVRINGVWRAVLAFGGLMLVAPSWESDIAALVILVPATFLQMAAQRASDSDAASGTH